MSTSNAPSEEEVNAELALSEVLGLGLIRGYFYYYELLSSLEEHYNLTREAAISALARLEEERWIRRDREKGNRTSLKYTLGRL